MLISAGSGARQLTFLRSDSLPFSVTVWVMLQLAVDSMRPASEGSRSEASVRLTGVLSVSEELGLALLAAGPGAFMRDSTKIPPASRTAAAMAVTAHVVSMRL